MKDPELIRCYRYHAWASDLDEEEIWSWVQRNQGYMQIRGDCIDFWVRERGLEFFLLQFPDLVRHPSLDYVD